MQQQYTYLLINFFTILVPLLFSFEKRINFYKQWKYLFPAILITGGFFIIWDHYLTAWNVWSFNPMYITGLQLWNLPIEEWLFFLTVPYSCMFIYVALNQLIKRDTLKVYSKSITIGLIIILSVIVVFNSSRLYTAIKLSLCVLMLIWIIKKDYTFMGKFYRAYFISLIPFFLVNGLLTALPVVIYNDNENLGIRIGTIPVEDTMYTLLLLLMNVVLFEYFRRRKVKRLID
jgi:lycopene cyclase domain-containing protein